MERERERRNPDSMMYADYSKYYTFTGQVLVNRNLNVFSGKWYVTKCIYSYLSLLEYFHFYVVTSNFPESDY